MNQNTFIAEVSFQPVHDKAISPKEFNFNDFNILIGLSPAHQLDRCIERIKGKTFSGAQVQLGVALPSLVQLQNSSAAKYSAFVGINCDPL